jgi:hypothetical protein
MKHTFAYIAPQGLEFATSEDRIDLWNDRFILLPRKRGIKALFKERYHDGSDWRSWLREMHDA